MVMPAKSPHPTRGIAITRPRCAPSPLLGAGERPRWRGPDRVGINSVGATRGKMAPSQPGRDKFRDAATSCKKTGAVDRRAFAGDNSLSASLFMGTMGSSPWGAWGRLSLRRENEHFSKRTKPAGFVSLRSHGNAAVDRGAVRRADCRAGGAWLCRLFHADQDEPGPRGAAKTEQGSHRAARPGEFAHRGLEEPDGDHHAASGLDAVGARAGQEPRRSDARKSKRPIKGLPRSSARCRKRAKKKS